MYVKLCALIIRACVMKNLRKSWDGKLFARSFEFFSSLTFAYSKIWIFARCVHLLFLELTFQIA